MSLSIFSRRKSISRTYDKIKETEYRHLKKKKIKELLKDKKHQINMECHKLLPQFNKTDSESICKCLNEKNGNLTLDELEYLTNNRLETPASKCILLYDKILRNTKSNIKPSRSHTRSRSRTRRSSRKSNIGKNN